MKILAYRGAAHVREISSADMARSWGIEASGISVDTRVSRLVSVSSDVAEKLIATGEFVHVGDVGDEEAPVEPAPEPEAPVVRPRRIKDQPQA
jgi:hypothetical protein